MRAHHLTAIACVTAAAFLVSPQQAQAAEPSEEVVEAVSYQCENGMTLAVSYVNVRGHEAVEIVFPDGRKNGEMARRLLPETQTGSGVRYASDITELHVKGGNARFQTAVSAVSEAIEPTECVALQDARSQGPATQAARAGRYFMRHPEGPGFFPVETMCFAEDGKKYFGLSRSSEPGQAVTYTETRLRYAKVSPVDAGAGQRRYTLTAVDDAKAQLLLNFIAPGMREADLPSATAGLSSVSEGSRSVDCVDNDRIVYAATGYGYGMVVTLEEDGLTFGSFGSEASEWQAMRQGYVTQLDGATVFTFLDGERRMRIVAHHSGGLVKEAHFLETPLMQRQVVSAAYFIADKVVFDGSLPNLDVANLRLIGSLGHCNHLAGETSSDQARNAELADAADSRVSANPERFLKVDEANFSSMFASRMDCDAVPAAYKTALEAAGEGSPLHEYLKANFPNWR